MIDQITCHFRAGLKFLVVDHEEIISFDIENQLRDNDATFVLTASTLEQAREILHHLPNICLVVFGLQDGNGVDLIPKLQGRHIPIVITTGKVLRMSDDNP
jgi:DNA-binding response OmpR family regulator